MLTTTSEGILINGQTENGVFYGCQTLRKSIPAEAQGADILLPAGSIKDEPRFTYRGMHLDVCRHFFPLEFIKEYIDLLALHNMNTFHWHLTDDQGWRIEIKKYPKLTEVGSKRNCTVVGKARSGKYDNIPYGGFYTQEQAKEIVKYARSKEEEYHKNFRFTITTNGMLLTDDKIDYINEEMSNVVLSIDGRKEVNDRMRVKVDGSGCYDRIVDNYKKLVEKRGDKEYYVRGTYTNYNLDFAEDVIHLYEQGFDQVSVEPVMEDESVEYAITEKDLDKIYAEYDKLVDKISDIKKNGGFINFFHFMIDLDQGPCVIKRLRGCGSGNEYVAITPDGDIYPCHQFVGHEEYKMGNLEEGTFNEDIKKEFAGCHVYSKPTCRDCWAKFYCSGGCAANAYNFSGDICGAYDIGCELQKKRIECAIMIKAAEADCE